MTTRHSTAAPRATLLLFLVVATSSAEAQGRSGPIEAIKAPDVFVHVGRFRAGSDEGPIGNGPSYGGTVTVPIWQRFVADFDYQTAHATRTTRYVTDLFTYRTRRRLFVTSLLYRFGQERVSGFIGGGIGNEWEDSTYRTEFQPQPLPGYPPPPPGSSDFPSGVVEVQTSSIGRLTSFRGGVVTFPTRKLGVRGELYMSGWHLGARVGVGYRFN
jgi:hypothetical protein